MKDTPTKKAMLLILVALFFVTAVPAEAHFSGRQVSNSDPLKSWVSYQTEKSEELLFKNISLPGEAAGAVVASPSRANPDYYYHWVRDAGLVMNTVLDLYAEANGNNKARYRKTLEDFISFSQKNQDTPNPTKQFHPSGLGEVKFKMNGSVIDQWWMRPQNDGPALRSITLIRFANMLLRDGGNEKLVRQIYTSDSRTHSVVKRDLEFLKDVWSHWSYDLWEECEGHHFYTRMVQYHALTEGAKLAERLGDGNAAKKYREVAEYLRVALKDHWDDRGFLRESFYEGFINGKCDYKRTGLDVATILAVLHTDGANGLYSVDNEKIIATAFEIDRAFTQEYPINRVVQSSNGKVMASAIGRYPYDRYNGYNVSLGNPWVLATNTFAEYNYRLAQSFEKQGVIEITPQTLKFFKALLGDDTLGKERRLQKGSALFEKTLKALVAKGDAYLERNRYHGMQNGSFSEQINRDTGHMQGAPDLTWNYSTFLNTFRVRAKN